MSLRNRNAGKAYELYIAKEFEYILDRKIVTSRAESRNRDNAGIDLCNTEPLQIQCKLTATLPKLDIFKRMNGYNDKSINMIVWGRTKRMKKYMVKDDDYVILPLEDFKALCEYLETKEDER
jgi:hypothetical protein